MFKNTVIYGVASWVILLALCWLAGKYPVLFVSLALALGARAWWVQR